MRLNCACNVNTFLPSLVGRAYKEAVHSRGIYLYIGSPRFLRLLMGTLYPTLLFIVPYSLHKSMCCATVFVNKDDLLCECTSSLNWRLYDVLYICVYS